MYESIPRTHHLEYQRVGRARELATCQRWCERRRHRGRTIAQWESEEVQQELSTPMPRANRRITPSVQLSSHDAGDLPNTAISLRKILHVSETTLMTSDAPVLSTSVLDIACVRLYIDFMHMHLYLFARKTVSTHQESNENQFKRMDLQQPSWKSRWMGDARWGAWEGSVWQWLSCKMTRHELLQFPGFLKTAN